MRPVVALALVILGSAIGCTSGAPFYVDASGPCFEAGGVCAGPSPYGCVAATPQLSSSCPFGYSCCAPIPVTKPDASKD